MLLAAQRSSLPSGLELPLKHFVWAPAGSYIGIGRGFRVLGLGWVYWDIQGYIGIEVTIMDNKMEKNM